MSNLHKDFIMMNGKAVANTIYPNDFELYFTALELVNSRGDTVDYFAFPINPTNIAESSSNIANIKKTASGVVTLSTSSYIPVDVEISGNFGRKYKVLVGRTATMAYAFAKGEMLRDVSGGDISGREFMPHIKSGYGCIKVLEKILKKADDLDKNNKPFSLYFYNLSLGHAYLVKRINFTFNQNMESNMIWNYSITLKTLSPLSKIRRSWKDLLSSAGLIFANTLLKTEVYEINNKILGMNGKS